MLFTSCQSPNKQFQRTVIRRRGVALPQPKCYQSNSLPHLKCYR